MILFPKGSLGTTVKLLPCDLEVMNSNPEKSLLQSKIRLGRPFPGSLHWLEFRAPDYFFFHMILFPSTFHLYLHILT